MFGLMKNWLDAPVSLDLGGTVPLVGVLQHVTSHYASLRITGSGGAELVTYVPLDKIIRFTPLD